MDHSRNQSRPHCPVAGRYRGSDYAVGAVKSITQMMTGTAIAMIAISIIAAPCGRWCNLPQLS